MGRPINKHYIGNTSQSGQQIQATAFFAGDSEPVSAYIAKQVAVNTYQMVSEAGTSSGRVQLVNGGAALQPGQANIVVTPYGDSGSNAAAFAEMGAFAATANVSVTVGDANADYDIGQTLTLSGGTSTQDAVFSITGIVASYMGIGDNSGQGYQPGNQITFGGAGWVSNARVAINTVNATGAITSFVQLAGGGIRNASAPSDPIAGVTLTGSGSNAAGTGATFVVQWGVSNVEIQTPGNYSVLPANGVATTTDSPTGTGATLDVTWGVSNVVVTNGGSDFDQAKVTFNSGTASAVATVNAAGSVSEVTVTNSGGPYTAIPGVIVGPSGSTEYAQEIRNRTVYTFQGNVYDWIMSDIDLTISNQARIQSA